MPVSLFYHGMFDHGRFHHGTFDHAIMIVPSIAAIAAGESQGRDRQQNGGGVIASHWLFVLNNLSEWDNTTERLAGIATRN
jgi:hypothetical protein